MNKEQIEEILKKFDKTEKTLIETTNELCDLFGVSNNEVELCGKCYETQGFYLGTTCPKCNRPFRSVKA